MYYLNKPYYAQFRILFLFIVVISFVNTSCNNNSMPDLTEGITGTYYIGSINVTSPPLQSPSYTVTVTSVSSTRVRIIPQTGQASEWEQDIMNPTSNYRYLKHHKR